MDLKKILLPAFLAGGALLFVFRKAKTAEMVQFRAEALKLIDFTLLYSKLRFNFSLLNPSPYAVKVNSFSGEILANGQSVANFSRLDEIKLSGKSAFKGNLEVNLSNAASIKEVLYPFAQGKPITLTIKGTLFLSAGPIDFIQNIPLNA